MTRRMKINLNQSHECIQALRADEPAVRWNAVCCLAKHSKEDWEGMPEIIEDVVEVLIDPDIIKGREASNPPFRMKVAKILGNIGARSGAVVPTLMRWLVEDRDVDVRTEAVRALGRIGQPARSAVRALGKVLKQNGWYGLRGVAAWLWPALTLRPRK